MRAQHRFGARQFETSINLRCFKLSGCRVCALAEPKVLHGLGGEGGDVTEEQLQAFIAWANANGVPI